ncbi:MAG: hypothetical protein PHY14_00655 [Candidatus Gracilibacteria bacterium]|nr:hypothetical protein [Candidatus Gracilibacteria bacterium]
MYTKHLVRGMGVLVQDGVKWNKENDGGGELDLRLLTVAEASAMESNTLMVHNKEAVNATLNKRKRPKKPRIGSWKQCPGRTELSH